MKHFISMFAIMISITLFAKVISSNIGGKQNLLSINNEKKEYTAKNYIQDGLIAMFDGIENAGWGIHDKEATTWIELIHGYNAISSGASGTFSITNDSYVFHVDYRMTGSGVLIASLGDSAAEVRQIEVVFSKTGDRAASALCLNGVGNRNFMCGNIDGNVYAVVGFSQYGDSGLSNEEIHSYSTSLSGGWPVIMMCYADSIVLDISKTATSISNLPQYSTGDMFIGYSGFNMGSTVTVNSIRLYRRQLSYREILHNYTIDKIRFNLP